MPNFPGTNGIPSRPKSSFVDVVVLEREELDATERGWRTPDFNVSLRGLGVRDDTETPTV